MSAVERQARRVWEAWAVYRKTTICACCHRNRYCGAARQNGRWLCEHCFDTSAEAERFLRRAS